MIRSFSEYIKSKNESAHTGSLSAIRFRRVKIWGHLGWRDVLVRYYGTLLGPFWSTAALFSVVLGTSLAVSILSNKPLFENASLLATKLALWTYVQNCLSEAPDLFRSERQLLLNTTHPEQDQIYRITWRNLIYYFHNLLVVAVFLIATEPRSILRVIILVIFGPIVGVALAPSCYFIARLGCRFRDLYVIVPTLLQLIFFATPIIWEPPKNGPGKVITDLNPIAWVLQIGVDISFRSELRTDLFLLFIVYAILSWLVFRIVNKKASAVRNVL